MMKNICFAGLVSETNLGDVVILKATEYLYKSSFPANLDIHFSRLDIKSQSPSHTVFYKLKIQFMELFRLNTRNAKIKKLINDSKQAYRGKLGCIDLIVVVGGGLIKYKYQRFFIYLIALIEVAEELHIPIVFNSVGVEGYDSHDFRCQMLKQALNRSIVKSITTRDDIDLLRNFYMFPGSDKVVAKTADPAVHSDEVYSVSKSESDVVGIGLIRGGIFLDNGKDFSADELADFYGQLIADIEQRKVKYKIFTNGLPADTELLPRIMARLGREQLDVIVPGTDAELVDIISGFSVVIAARLHANIIAYALNVPSIGLVWNNKLSMFGHDIGYAKRFFEVTEMHAENVLDAALKAREEGYDQRQWREYKGSVKQSIGSIIDRFLTEDL